MRISTNAGRLFYTAFVLLEVHFCKLHTYLVFTEYMVKVAKTMFNECSDKLWKKLNRKWLMCVRGVHAIFSRGEGGYFLKRAEGLNISKKIMNNSVPWNILANLNKFLMAVRGIKSKTSTLAHLWYVCVPSKTRLFYHAKLL